MWYAMNDSGGKIPYFSGVSKWIYVHLCQQALIAGADFNEAYSEEFLHLAEGVIFPVNLYQDIPDVLVPDPGNRGDFRAQYAVAKPGDRKSTRLNSSH